MRQISLTNSINCETYLDFPCCWTSSFNFRVSFPNFYLNIIFTVWLKEKIHSFRKVKGKRVWLILYFRTKRQTQKSYTFLSTLRPFKLMLSSEFPFLASAFFSILLYSYDLLQYIYICILWCFLITTKASKTMQWPWGVKANDYPMAIET